MERGLAERGRGDYYKRVEGYCFTDEQGNTYVASVKWVFQVMGDGGRRFWFEGVELGRAKVESVEDVVARITGGADDRGAEGEKKREKRRRVRVRIIARIRAGGRDDESSIAYYTYIDGERYVLSKNPAPIIEDGWGWEVSAGLRQTWLRPCHGL